MKIVFFDIDGVINTHEQNQLYLNHPAKSHGISRDLVEILNEVFIETGAVGVVISFWRYMVLCGSMTVIGFENMLKSHGFIWGRLVGITCSNEEVRGRGAQIMRWLVKEAVECEVVKIMAPPAVSNYVIIDDADDGNSLLHPGRFVQTNCHVGITINDVDRAIDILNR